MTKRELAGLIKPIIFSGILFAVFIFDWIDRGKFPRPLLIMCVCYLVAFGLVAIFGPGGEWLQRWQDRCIMKMLRKAIRRHDQ